MSPSAMSKFLRQYPDIEVEIIIDYGLPDIVAQRVDAGVLRTADELLVLAQGRKARRIGLFRGLLRTTCTLFRTAHTKLSVARLRGKKGLKSKKGGSDSAKPTAMPEMAPQFQFDDWPAVPAEDCADVPTG